MAEHHPAPLVPPEVNMGNNDYFPFYFDRLRKSKWWRRASDVAKARNVTMWGEAYKSAPAGSLPDDDEELAEAAGYGFDVEAFLAHKADIMRPWVLCSDGRWYHPTVCEVVLETWSRMSERRRAERERKAEYRKRTRTQRPDEADAASPLRPTGQRAVSHGTPPDVPAESALKERRGQENSVASASQLATVEGGKSRKGSQGEAWREDQGFMAFWDACTPQARRRSSLAKSWTEWLKLEKRNASAALLPAYRRYLKDDPDVQRTGGPGVHIWLKDKFESWTQADKPMAADWSPERWAIAVELWQANGAWGEDMGPPPGQPGCRAPQVVLAPYGLGLRVVNGGAA